ncbi:MAG: acetyltransferase, partial [Anaerolineaceae bacterium]|nr:acetyltransferase [Anaerolineaceae bacterium]
MNNVSIKKYCCFGAGGFGLEVAMLIEQINDVSNEWNLIGFFDDGVEAGTLVNGYPVLGGVKELNCWKGELHLSLALGIPKTKKTVFEKIKNKNVTYPTLIHPNVISGKSEYVKLGEGCIVCAGNIITTNIEIGKHVILNLACTVGHETKIGDFSSFMPTCNISGEVTIGESTFWGTGAKVINQTKIGNNVIIGAGAVVTTDIPDDVTAVGIPAKVINSQITQIGADGND